MTIPFAAFPLYSLKEFGKLLQQGLLFYVVLYFFQEKMHRTRLLALLIGVFAIVAAYGITEFRDTGRVSSFLPSEVWLTTYLIMFLPLCFALALYEERPVLKACLLVICGLATGCLLLTQSRAGLVAFVCELWILAWFARRRALYIMACVFSLILLAAAVYLVRVAPMADDRVVLGGHAEIPLKTNVNSVIHRLEIWSFSLARISEHPIVGIGYGKETFKMVFGRIPEKVLPGHTPVHSGGAHNILLELPLHVGLPGLALFLWLAIRIAKTALAGFHRAVEPRAKAVMLGLLVSVVGIGVRTVFDQMFVGTLAILFWIFAAVTILEGQCCGRVMPRESLMSSLRGLFARGNRTVQGLR
jgi:O-antigen ligase